jgi:hypothetical protein
MQERVAEEVQAVDTLDNWRRRLSSSPSPDLSHSQLFDGSLSRSTRPWLVLSSDSSSSGAPSSPLPSLPSFPTNVDAPFPDLTSFTEVDPRLRLSSPASDISEGTRAFEDTVMDYGGAAAEPAPFRPPPTARHVLFDDDGQPIHDDRRHYFDTVARMLAGRLDWASDSDSDFVPEDCPTPGWTSASESDNEGPSQALHGSRTSSPSSPVHLPRRRVSDQHPFWNKRWPLKQRPSTSTHTPGAFLKQCLRLAADRVVEAKGLEHPIFGPFHPEEDLLPAIPEWLAVKLEPERPEVAVKPVSSMTGGRFGLSLTRPGLTRTRATCTPS